MKTEDQQTVYFRPEENFSIGVFFDEGGKIGSLKCHNGKAYDAACFAARMQQCWYSCQNIDNPEQIEKLLDFVADLAGKMFEYSDLMPEAFELASLLTKVRYHRYQKQLEY